MRRGRQRHLTLASLVPDEVLRALAIALVLRLGVQQARGIHACDRPDSGVCSRVEKSQHAGLRTRYRAWRGASALRAALPRPQRTARRAHARGAQQLVFRLLNSPRELTAI